MERNCCVCGTCISKVQRGSVDVFATESLSSTVAASQDTLTKLLSKTVNQNINYLRNTRLEKICRRCLGTLRDINELERRVDCMKNDLQQRFAETRNKFCLEEKLKSNPKPAQRIAIIFKEKANPSNVEITPKELSRTVEKQVTSGPAVTVEEEFIPLEYRDLAQPDGTFKCRFCKRRFVDLASNLHHMVDYHKAVSVRCSICDESFRNILDLRRHKLSDHPEFSDEKTFRVNDLVLRNVECNRCDRQFPNNKSLNVHVKMCHMDGVAPSGPNSDMLNYNLICTICEYHCRNREEMLDHLNEDHWVDRPYSCHFCLLAYKHREEYTLHVQHKHNGEHVCSRCYTTFSNEQGFEFHVKEHFKRPKFILECKFCTLKFTEKELLDDHTHLRHSESIDKDECLLLTDEPAMEVELGASEVVCDAPISVLDNESYVLMGSDSLISGSRVARGWRL